MSASFFDERRRTPSPTSVLLVASAGSFLAFLDSTIVNVAFPNIEASFPHASVGTLSWVLNAYNIVFAAFLVAAGRITDLVGRRRAFTLGVSLFTIASGLCAAAGSVDALITFRLIQGFGAAMLVPASLSLIMNAYDVEHRSHGIGLYGAASALAAGLGPPAGGALVELANWRLCFLVNVPLGIIAILCARRTVVESRSPGKRRRPDLLGAMLVGVGLGAFTLGTVKGGDYGWGSQRTVAAYLLSAVALCGFLISSRRHPSPLIDPALLRLRSFSVSSAATVLGGVGFYAYLLTHILWLNYVWHYSLLKAGLAVAPGALIATIVAASLGKVADRRGHVAIVVPGAIIWALSFFWYVEVVPTHPDFLRTWLPGQVMSGIGVGSVLPILGSGALKAVPEAMYATASAVVSSARQLGGALGIAVLVVVIGTPNPLTIASHLRHAWAISGACFLGVALVTLFATSAKAAVPGTDTDLVGAEASPSHLRTRSDVVDLAGATVSLDGAASAAHAGGGPGAAHLDQVGVARRRSKQATLRDLPLFQGLPAATLHALDAAARVIELPAGETLVTQGERTDDMWVVQRGRLEVIRDGINVSMLGAGAIVGELALLTGSPRSATVRAVRDSALLQLDRATFDKICGGQPAVMRTLAATLAERLSSDRPAKTGASPATVVAVIGTDRLAPVSTIASTLVGLLRRHRSVTAPERISPAALEVAETAFDLVVLSAGADDEPSWREFCIRVADRKVFVHCDQQLPAAPEREAGSDLVFIGALPTGELATRWERGVAPRSRHLVTSATDAVALTSGLRPLAARLVQRSLGLVLAGGGARAFAHLGVLEVLEAEGIHVDRIAGTSVGAGIAASWAMGWDAAKVDAAVYAGFVRIRPFGDYTIPISGISRGKRTVSFAERVFGDTLIEELPREFRCVSVDLLRRERFVHREGRVCDAVAASLRLPALYPPYRIGNSLHVDGGVLDNLPVSTLTEPREGPVVAVSISFGGDSSGSTKDRTRPPRMPPLADTVLRSLMMGSAGAAAEARKAADLVISPPSAGVGLLEFHQIDTMREAGRAATIEALPRLRALLDGTASPETTPVTTTSAIPVLSGR